MSKISVNIKGLSLQEFSKGITPLEIMNEAKGVPKDSIICKVDGLLTDLSAQLSNDCELQFMDAQSKEGHSVLLHSTAHLMAQAVKRLFPKTKVTIGPYLENRFYYDFDVETPFTEEDLLKIEDEMTKISEENLQITHEIKSRDDSISYFEKINENYKVEIINDLDLNETLKVYSQGEFTDLCRGPHVPYTGVIKNIKLLSSSAAYWRGDEKNQTLQRVYGTSFQNIKDLKKYLLMLEEQKKRDHRKIGKELDLFFFDDEVGPGLPLWTPSGTVLIDQLEALAKEKETAGGYLRVRTPHLTKGDLFSKSGHLEHYMSSMFSPMDVDGIDYYMKPMNCPYHHKIYANTPKSYRDLPYRISEYGTCYRYEKSGELFGLMRVRSMQMNDGHIYCTEEQFKEEFINNPTLWKKTEDDVRNALKGAKLKFVESVGDAAFYGPKIDVQVWSSIGREFTLATNQVDFAIPERFDLTYTDKDGTAKTPLCIHRAPLGTHERFIGFLIEHFGGNFPLWLAPKQVTILPVSDKFNDYAQEITNHLITKGVRASIDNRSEKIGSKIRDAEMQKINIMVIVGEKEQENKTLTVRRRFVKEQEELNLDDFSKNILSEINERRVSN